MNRRAFFGLLASVPFLRRLAPAAPPEIWEPIAEIKPFPASNIPADFFRNGVVASEFVAAPADVQVTGFNDDRGTFLMAPRRIKSGDQIRVIADLENRTARVSVNGD